MEEGGGDGTPYGRSKKKARLRHNLSRTEKLGPCFPRGSGGTGFASATILEGERVMTWYGAELPSGG